jgi:hypothetical protein
MKTLLSTKSFIDALLLKDIITIDVESSSNDETLYIENHCHYELYYDLNATDDTYDEDLLRIISIKHDGYDWYCTTNGIDNQSFLDCDVEYLVIKKSIKSLDDID